MAADQALRPRRAAGKPAVIARGRLVIVQHHRVGRPPRAARYKRMFTTPALLTFQVRLLRAAGYRFLTLRDALSAPGRRAAVTFDDGYRDHMEEAAAILGGLGVPATIFVVSAEVGRAQVVWGESGDRLAGDLLGWDELAGLQERGWEIGSHGHWHLHLARQAPEVQEEHARLARAALDSRLGAVPRSFAYPYGSFDETTVAAVRGAGFTCAVTALRGANDQDADPFRLRRRPGGGRAFRHALASVRLLT